MHTEIDYVFEGVVAFSWLQFQAGQVCGVQYGALHLI